MSKHRATTHRTPYKAHRRFITNRWYGFIKPDLKRRHRALQSQIEQTVRNFINKIRKRFIS